ncbi:MAG TPA: phytanoyl-CoA dioxygenase family protein [Caldilineaceae bacterium]|nr:phytanoyl-CoA dioxygenase family protein [Caldilineaceae bacterium]
MAEAVLDLNLYQRQGFLSGLPVFAGSETPALLALYWRLRALLPPGMSTQQMDWWHGQDRELWEICTHPRILGYVEAILGPDFYLWGTQFFSKDPGDGKTTPWHQDAFYWPLTPHKAVTVWLAFTDSDEENGAMRVIPGTHRVGRIQHVHSDSASDVLNMELAPGAFREADAVSLILKAGQVSLHDDNIVHGSAANRSQRLRCGLTMRYSAGEVKCDLAVWPFFKAYWLRGVDRWQHNPTGTPPTGPMTQYVKVAG